jgi:hypothetical protein
MIFFFPQLHATQNLVKFSKRIANLLKFPTFFIGPVPPGAGTIALDPTFGSFTLLEPVSH